MKVKLAEEIFFKEILLSLYKLSNKSFIGEFKSAFKGLGLDFYQNRIFTQNDSIKLINWNLYAKLRTLYIKEYIEDRNRFNLILLDISSSMFQKFKNKSKIETALQVVFALLYSSLKSNDNTGLILFDNEIRYFFPFNRKLQYFFKILNMLKSLYIEPKPTGYIEHLYKNIFNILKKRSQIFFVSDFSFKININLLTFLTQKHSLTSILILDKEEEKLSSVLKFYTSIEKPSLYKQIPYHVIVENTIKEFNKSNIDTIVINTDEEVYSKLQQFFEYKITKH
ncbi:MAG: DUF58 domain-containing protein [Exilispira sp.]